MSFFTSFCGLDEPKAGINGGSLKRSSAWGAAWALPSSCFPVAVSAAINRWKPDRKNKGTDKNHPQEGKKRKKNCEKINWVLNN